MARKLYFWIYFSIVFIVIRFVPTYLPLITNHQQEGLVFDFTAKPFYLLMVSILNLLFDYVSLIMPVTELLSIQIFLLVRKPSLRSQFKSYVPIILHYFVPYVLVKAFVLSTERSMSVLVWIGISIVTWVILLVFLINQHYSYAKVATIILTTFIFSRILATIMF
ncbi:Uncharacterized protein LEKG_0022 [Leuconostoc gasicomitatum KG16-1]|nr:Uncharacterized protein LEKG_0022 [Leuconostoc gasicomitatum KG16-1]